MIKKMIDLFKFIHHYSSLEYFDLKNDLFIEWQELIYVNDKLSYCVHALNKKAKVIFKREYTLNEDLDFNKKVWKSSLIVFSVEKNSSSIVLIKLRELCCKMECFGTIAIAQKGDILFFPNLKYQDVLWVKDIVSKLLDNENYYFAYATKNNFVLV